VLGQIGRRDLSFDFIPKGVPTCTSAASEYDCNSVLFEVIKVLSTFRKKSNNYCLIDSGLLK
jgi:hypothetical protein